LAAFGYIDARYRIYSDFYAPVDDKGGRGLFIYYGRVFFVIAENAVTLVGSVGFVWVGSKFISSE
jgi:hypothetical protein